MTGDVMVQTAFIVMKTHWETSGEHLINQSKPSLSRASHLIEFSFFTYFSLSF
jgi:hypothetical protein